MAEQELIDDLLRREYHRYPNPWQYNNRVDIIKTAIYYERIALTKELKELEINQ